MVSVGGVQGFNETTSAQEIEMAEKTVNYTPEMTASLVEAYKAEPNKATVEAFAVKFGKTAKSVIAKLSKEGVYVKAAYVGKNGEKPEKKDSVADAIGLVLGLNENDVSSLAKANKTALKAIFDALANSKPISS